MAESLKLDHSNVAISAIFPVADNFIEKVAKVNKFPVFKCCNKDIQPMSQDNVNPKRHLSKSKLHFSNYSSGVSVKNLKEFLNRFKWLKCVKAIEGVYNSLWTNRDIDNTFSNDLEEIHKQKIENYKRKLNSVWDYSFRISWIEEQMAGEKSNVH